MCSTLRKCGTYSTEVAECHDHGSPFQGRKKGGNSVRDNFDKRNCHHEHGGYERPPSHYQENDGSVEIRDVHKDQQLRHTPYSIRCDRRMQWHSKDEICITTWRNRKPPGRKMRQNTQDGYTRTDWFKVTIPNGIKYDKSWLMNSIQSHCSAPFTPVDFHYIRNRACFFVQDASTASILKDVSYKICDDENRKICIFVNHSTAPYSVKNKLKPGQMEMLKLTMNKRYNVSQQALDLQNLRFDPDLMGRDIDIILNRRNCMAATLKIIERNFPELLSLNLCNNKLYQLDGLSDIIEKAPKVKTLNLSKNKLESAWELGKVKGLKLEELWLEGNPLCSTFSDQSAYVSAIRDCFPKLLRLDGRELSAPMIVDIDRSKIMKPCKENFTGSETLKHLVLQFLQQYYSIYDSGDRQGLLGAYHDEACFSLAIPFDAEDSAPNSLRKYFEDSRNMKTLKDPHLKGELLRHTKRDIVDSLSALPKTQHDLSSILVDMWCQTEWMLCFSVNGVFKEVEGQSQGSVLAFTRTFIATPGSSSSLCIVNDELFVRDASPQETQSAFSIPVSTLSSSSEPSLSQEQQEMVQAFSAQSGMKLEWSQKCLQDNEWNYTRAGQVFTMLQTEGKIPAEAFKQIS
ncbi:nuclear RNA export factor 2 isoform X1 [Trachypithecus francoisi]|uniref:nuclear RNA export factor 2 n=2 Tax=Trachypithecus francoisi TaxID=54180 RepID=UPI00141B7791|nr:nuclear RNA export factor 2 [Trachypithecus francoisi]XP_033069828.1 nuclear RNA export factor 2 isoform X1 [Trachypithecus francoisi]